MLVKHSLWLRNVLCIAGVLGIILVGLTACGTTTANNSPKTPIKIGAALSLTGNFSADGKAFQQGYELWAADVNKNGGLLGRQVQLDIVDDASDTNQVVTDYNKLISVDKVDLVIGPYSSLLTKPASEAVNRYGYAMLEGAGGAPSVFNRGLKNVFDVSLPVANNIVSFANYILSLPASERPKTAAYATSDDPFTQPQVDIARAKLEAGGITTAYQTVYPAETTDFTPIAASVIQSKADIVVLGTHLQDFVAFAQAFRQQHYNPQALIGTAGPNLGADFTKAIGGTDVAEGIFVPNDWFPGADNYQNAQFVQEYIAQYGGTAADISADVAEGYAVGQVLYQAVTKINSLDNAKLIAELHSGDTFKSVQGLVKFDDTGQNIVAQSYLFQWQNGNYVPVFPAGTAGGSNPEFPKPQWP
jgi:branched-chain amino acid transport system substrate-binding protein